MILTYENENGTIRSRESFNGRLINSRPSLKRINVGSVLEVTDETILYFSETFGDLETSILPNFNCLLAYLKSD